MATAVAKKKSAEVAVMDENMFAADAGIGVNDLGSEDLAIPFIKVLQKMSDELDDLEDAKAGDIYNTVTKEVVKGKDGVRLINCAYNLQYIEWEPRGTGTGAPHAIYGAGDEIPATERGDDNKDYVAGGSGRYLERTAQHYVLVVDEDGMTQQALLPMKSTQFKKSKQWNSAMRSLKMKDSNGGLFTPPRFSHIWKLETVSEENKNGSWHGWQISKDDVVKDPSVYAEAKLFAESIQAGQVNVKHVREEDKPSSDEDLPF
jgi:hypothetical protein|tara:strand:+ start:11405 stop:12184 length:780 start_codon:yes stop_codon:yes gene_type:complete